MLGHDNTINPNDLDDGIRDSVVLLQQGGFRTFTSCEGGRGHSFQHATIGLQLEGEYPTFQRKLVEFLRSQGMQNFTISLVTDFHPDYPEGKNSVYVEGLDLLSEDKRKQVIESSKQRDRKLRRDLRELGIEKAE
jgi:hypothetical protein